MAIFTDVLLRSQKGSPLTYAEMDSNFNNIRHATNPIGSMVFFLDPDPLNIPTTWLYCNGAELSKTQYSDLYTAIGDWWGDTGNSNTFYIPDLRAAFIRGIDAGRGEDPDRVWGSFQDSTNKEHVHTFKARARDSSGGGTVRVSDVDLNNVPGGFPDYEKTVDSEGDAVEARPRNYPAIFIIKAYDPGVVT